MASPSTSTTEPRAPRAVLALAAALGGACGGSDPRPDVLLLTVDTLRADHLGCYGAPGNPTPRIDALAVSGTLFEKAAAPMGMTRPSHFTLFTSLYPREHGVVNNAIALPDELVTLPERFRAAGWRTGAFVSVAILGERSGAEQGFEVLDEPRRGRERPAAETVPRALHWLDDLPREEPWFLWVHLFDPHLPYEPAPRFRAGLGLDPALETRHPGLSWDDLKDIAAANGGDVPRAVLEHARALYRGEVAAVDHWVGALLDGIAGHGGADETAVVFTADHGESFGQGIWFEHADCLFESTLHVPLVVRWPALFPPGERRSEQVSSVDVAPTVLSVAGLPVPNGFSGRSLAAPDPTPAEDRYVLVQHPLYQPRAARGRQRRQNEIRSVAGQPTTEILVEGEKTGLVGREWKYLRSGDEEELYHLTGEGGEDVDLSEVEVERRDALRARLDAALERHPLELIEPGLINDELLETLKALGYGY